MLNNLLIYRLIIVNLIGLSCLIWAYFHGYVQDIWNKDITYLSPFMFALFLVGTFSGFIRAKKISHYLNMLKSGTYFQMNPEKFKAKTQHIGELSIFLISIGFIGTLIGLSLSLPKSSSFSDAVQMIGQMTGGLHVAIYTGLVGSILGVWAELNKLIIYTAMDCMIEDYKVFNRKRMLQEMVN